MKNTELIVLGLAGLAVYMIVKNKGTTTASAGGTVSNLVKEIFGTGGQAFDNGWRYFDDGTAIDPLGNYYLKGQMVWQAPGAGRYV